MKRRNSGERRSAVAGRVGSAPRRPRAHRPRFARPWRPQDPGPKSTGGPVDMAPILARWHASADARGARRCRLEAVPTPPTRRACACAEISVCMGWSFTRMMNRYEFTDLQWRQARRAGGQERPDGTYVGAPRALRADARRVGGGGLCPPEPERGKVWKPSQGFHHADVRVHHGRAQRVRRWTFPEEHSCR